MAIYYHGTSAEPFDRFDLSHALEGDGKVKYGFGIYVTPVYENAAHYAGANPQATTYYVYTVEIPDILPDNHIGFKEPVDASIIERAQKALGEQIPESAVQQGAFFRKYLANRLTGRISTVKQMTSKSTYDGEKAASAFLAGIGVVLFTWPYDWKELSRGYSCSVLEDSLVVPKQMETVELYLKGKSLQLVPGSQKLVRKF